MEIVFAEDAERSLVPDMRRAVWGIIAAFAIALDQISKYIVVKQLKPVGTAAFIPYLIGFRYIENTGAAFGMMQGYRWLFITLSSVAIIAISVFLVVSRKKIHMLTGIGFAMIVGGGIGNQIDRILNGFVVDFIEFQFVEFAVFNIADSFVTIGAVIVIICALFIDKDLFSSDMGKKPVAETEEKTEDG